MKNPISVAVLGGGSAAFAAAADLKMKGCIVHLFEVPELADQTLSPILQSGGIEVVSKNVPSVRPGFAKLDVMTDDPEQALAGTDIVLYLTPAFAETRFTALCAPHFRREQLIVLFCGNFGGALEVARCLAENRVAQLQMIAETDGLVYACSKLNPTTVKIGGIKSQLSCAALPAKRTEEALNRLKSIFPDFQAAGNVLETSLRNINPVLHAPVSILNAGRTAEPAAPWRYYWDGITEPVGRILEKVDEERRAVAGGYDISVPAAKDMLLNWYGGQGAHGSTLGEIASTNPTYETIMAPKTLNHRFITEDIPFGLVPIESLGSIASIPTPSISALITLASELLETDFREAGRNLEKLGLKGLTPYQVQQLAKESEALPI